LNIVPFPPPLLYFSWDEVNPIERKMAFLELPELNKTESCFRDITFAPDQQPREWRSWNSMDVWQRKSAFEVLQVILLVSLANILQLLTAIRREHIKHTNETKFGTRSQKSHRPE
jgi:hypothetical protein